MYKFSGKHSFSVNKKKYLPHVTEEKQVVVILSRQRGIYLSSLS